MPSKALTAEQKADAARLTALYLAWRDERRARGETANQKSLLPDADWSQSVISQYMQGVVPLNPAAVIKFASALGVAPMDISPTIGELLLSWVPIASRRPASGAYPVPAAPVKHVPAAPSVEEGLTAAMYRYARMSAAEASRTVTQQLQYWCRLGAALEPTLTVVQVRGHLKAADAGLEDASSYTKADTTT